MKKSYYFIITLAIIVLLSYFVSILLLAKPEPQASPGPSNVNCKCPIESGITNDPDTNYVVYNTITQECPGESALYCSIFTCKGTTYVFRPNPAYNKVTRWEEFCIPD